MKMSRGKREVVAMFNAAQKPLVARVDALQGAFLDLGIDLALGSKVLEDHQVGVVDGRCLFETAKGLTQRAFEA